MDKFKNEALNKHTIKGLVSVVVPTYNQEEFLAETLTSILSQTYTNLEVIVSDDASTDSSLSIIEAFAEKDKRLKLFTSAENRGIPYNFNRAFDYCQGEFVAFFSGDDLMLPTKIEKEVQFLHAHPSYDLVMHEVEIFDSLTGEIQSIHRDTKTLEVPRTPLMWAFPTKWAFGKQYLGLLPTSFLARSHYYLHARYDERFRYKHELLFHLDVFMEKPQQEWAMIPEVLSKYRVHANNFTQNKSLSKLREEEKFLIHAIVTEKYPELAKISRSFLHFTLFENLLFFNILEKNKKYLSQFYHEAGVFKLTYFLFCRFLHKYKLLFPLFKIIRLLFRIE